jgi:hypothetical protein
MTDDAGSHKNRLNVFDEVHWPARGCRQRLKELLWQHPCPESHCGENDQ